MGLGLGGLQSGGSVGQTIANLIGQVVSMLKLTLTQASGSDALAISTNGARVHFGAGANDFATSDGTTVTFAGPLATAGAFSLNGSNNITYAAGQVLFANGIGVSSNGNHWHFGTGANDFATSDGTTVTFAGPIATASSLSFTAFSDGSGTPGNATNNNVRGVNAIAGAASTCAISNTFVSATSLVLCVLQTNDATATSIKSVVPGASTFTITTNAAATGTTKFGWVVLN